MLSCCFVIFRYFCSSSCSFFLRCRVLLRSVSLLASIDVNIVDGVSFVVDGCGRLVGSVV